MMKLKDLRQVIKVDEKIILVDNTNNFLKTDLLFSDNQLKENQFILNCKVLSITSISIDNIPYTKIKIDFDNLFLLFIPLQENELKNGFKCFLRLNQKNKDFVNQLMDYYKKYIESEVE